MKKRFLAAASAYYLGRGVGRKIPVHRQNLTVAERDRQLQVDPRARATLEASACDRDLERATGYRIRHVSSRGECDDCC